MPDPLRATDAELVAAIARLERARGYCPTVGEIAAELGYRSKSSVHTRLRRLADQGRIAMGDGPRTIRVLA